MNGAPGVDVVGEAGSAEEASSWRSRSAAILSAAARPPSFSMAMFVLVVDTSLMNVSISAVVDDLDTTVSGVQSAIALEALVSAAFILIGSKVGDLFGRKRAYVLGLLGYAVGAVAMTLAQDLTAIVIFWAVLGGIGASLLLPAMQSLIHGNFEGAAQKKVYALVGASAAIAAAVGPLLGGFITTYLSWRVAFLLEAVVIAIVLSGIKLVRDVPYTGDRSIDLVGAALSVVGMGGLVLGILVWQEGGESVGALLAVGLVGLGGLVRWLMRRKREGKPTLIDPGLFESKRLQARGLPAADPADRAGRHDDRAADLPADGARVQRAGGRPVHRSALAQHVRRRAAGREEGGQAAPEQRDPLRVPAPHRRARGAAPDRAASRLRLGPPRSAGDRGLGARPVGVPAQQLHALADLGGARQRGRRRELGGGIVRAVVRLGVRGRDHAGDALDRVHGQGRVEQGPAAPADQQRVADVLEDDAQVMSNTQLEKLLAEQPEPIQDEIIRINTDARPLALQVALLIPILAGLVGLFNSFRMMRLPDPTPSSAVEGLALG